MGKTCVVLFLAVLLVSSIRPAYACDCVRPGSACQEFGAAEAVFVGRVVAADERRVEFAVLEALGGISHSTVVLQQPGSDCDFRFEVRQEYLVYAKEGKDAGRLTASICSRTALLVQSRSDLAYLRTLSTLPPDTRARITGSVVRWKDGSSIRRSGSVPIPSTSVFLSDGAQSFKGATDKNGRFHIPNVPFGRYEIRVEPPAGLYFTGHPPLNIFDPRECEPLNLSVRYDGRIFGRVLDANGRNVGGVALALIDSASRAHPNPEPALFARTLLDGQFEFRRVQPGSYVLSVDTHRT
jgi:hypothetical protein